MKRSTIQHKALRLLLILILVTTFWGTLPAAPARAATITVLNTDPSGPGSLDQAIIDANPGDVILFHESLEDQTISLTSTLSINKNLTIDGSDLDPHIKISGSNIRQIINISGIVDVSLIHLDLVDGSNNPGGAISSNSTSLTIENCHFSGNSSGSDGGAINHVGGTLTITESTFTGNSANGQGGAIYSGLVSGAATITRSTFVGNYAGISGGAISNRNMAAISNSSIANNNSPIGGGIYNTGTLTLKNSTLSANYANTSSGGGILDTGTLHMSNNIIANSPTGGDCALLFTGVETNISNLIEDGSCSPAISGDPGLAALADNGGPTDTMAITQSSPAFDTGDDSSCESVDQRGISRPQSDHCDIGAYELGNPEIDLQGNGQSISNGDSTPTLTDHTDFGSAFVGISPVIRTFTIENSGGAVLNLTDNPNYIQITGTHAADFSVTTQPTSPVTAIGGTTSFTVSFSPSAAGLRSAEVNIANNDSDENPYNFSIQGTGTVPEINLKGKSLSIVDGDTTPSSTDDTDFGGIVVDGGTEFHIFTIENNGDGDLTLTGTPKVVISGSHASDFSVTNQPTSPVASGGGTTTFEITFDPSAVGLRSAEVSIANNDIDENPYTFAIQGTGSEGTFSDVTTAHWAFQYVEAIADAGLTSGYPDGTYRPENPVTRAEMAVFLLNGMGVTAPPTNGSHPFSDIAGHWAEKYIEELFDQGITGGYPDGTYRPENLVTRAEMAVFLLKGIGVTPPALDGSHPFTDVAGHWAEIFIEELFDQGITGGYPDGTYRPENRVTRAEMAVFLVNTFNIPLP